MSDLASLLQDAPGSAAFMIGQQNNSQLGQQQAETQRLQQLIQSLQIQNQQSQQMNPLLLEHQGLQNQGLSAELPGKTADSSLKATNASKAAGTLTSDIDAGNSNNATTVAQNHIKIMRSAADALYAASKAGEAAGDNPILQQAAVARHLQENGVPLDGAVGQMATKMTPQQLTQYADDIMTHTEDYKKSTDVETQRVKSALAVAQEHSRGALAVTQAQIDAGRWNKNDKTSIDSLLASAKTSTAKAEILEQAIAVAVAKNAPADEIIALRQRAVEARQRAAEDNAARAVAAQSGQINVGAATGMATNPAPQATAPIGGVSPSGASPLPPAGGALKPPSAAIMALRANPALKAQFDSKYGAGASDAILKGK